MLAGESQSQGGEGGGGGGAEERGVYSFVACLSNLIVDRATLSRRSTVPGGVRRAGGGTVPIRFHA